LPVSVTYTFPDVSAAIPDGKEKRASDAGTEVASDGDRMVSAERDDVDSEHPPPQADKSAQRHAAARPAEKDARFIFAMVNRLPVSFVRRLAAVLV